MKTPSRQPNAAERFLGERIKQCRQREGLSVYALARQIRVKTQQIDSYEQGGFVSLPIIEKLADAFGESVDKKVIRRISFLRKLEIERGEEQPELIEWYERALPIERSIERDE